MNRIHILMSVWKTVCTVVLFCTVTAIVAPAQTFNILASFGGSNGSQPNALIQASDGNFYGTTIWGVPHGSDAGYGTVFQITASGTLTTLHIFSGTDGAYPRTALVQATDGNFYGTTALGGANSQGTVFRMSPGGALTTIYNFCSEPGCSDGSRSFAGLVQGSDGNFYGIMTETARRILPFGGLPTEPGMLFKAATA